MEYSSTIKLTKVLQSTAERSTRHPSSSWLMTPLQQGPEALSRPPLEGHPLELKLNLSKTFLCFHLHHPDNQHFE